MNPSKKKVGIFTLAIMLIAIGTISLINIITDMRILDDPFLFWPVFLIILGLEIILTKLYLNITKKDVSMTFDIVSILVVCIILLFNSLYTGFNFSNFTSLFYRGYTYRFDTTITEEIKDPEFMEEIEEIIITNHIGSITFKHHNESTIKIEADIEVKTNNKAVEDDLDKTFRIIKTDQNLKLESRIIGTNERITANPHIDFTIYIPKTLETDIVISNGIGDIYINNHTGGINVLKNHGKLTLQNIIGDIKAKNSFGTVNISDIRGKLELNNNHGAVRVENIYSDTVISNSFNTTECINITGNLWINSQHGNINAENIEGSLDINNSFGDVKIKDAFSDVTAEGSHMYIEVISTYPLRNDYNLRTTFNSIIMFIPELENVKIEAETSFGSIKGLDDNMIVKRDMNETRGEAVIGTGEFSLNLRTQNGDIIINQ